MICIKVLFNGRERAPSRQETRDGEQRRERNTDDELTIIRLHSVARAPDGGQCSAARHTLPALRDECVSISCELRP